MVFWKFLIERFRLLNWFRNLMKWFQSNLLFHLSFLLKNQSRGSLFKDSIQSKKNSMIFLFSYNKNNLPFSLSQWLGPNPGPCTKLRILSMIKTFTSMTCKVSKCKRLQKIQLIYVFAQTLRDFLLRFTHFYQILLTIMKILSHLCEVFLIFANFTV